MSEGVSFTFLTLLTSYPHQPVTFCSCNLLYLFIFDNPILHVTSCAGKWNFFSYQKNILRHSTSLYWGTTLWECWSDFVPSHRRVLVSSVTLQRSLPLLALFTVEAISNCRAILLCESVMARPIPSSNCCRTVTDSPLSTFKPSTDLFQWWFPRLLQNRSLGFWLFSYWPTTL